MTDFSLRPVLGGGLGVALAIATVASPWASSHPDGLERVAEDLQFHHQGTVAWTLPGSQWLADYTVAGVPQTLSTPLAGAIGTLAAFGMGGLLALGLKPRPPQDGDL